MKKIWDSIKSYVYIIAIVLLIRTFIVTPAIVNGESMESTLFNGEVVFINKIYMKLKDLKRFDIVVIKNKEDNDRIIKRIIAMPNEVVEYKNNKLYINNRELVTDIKFEFTEDFKTETKDGEYFVLGDNRDISKDSRMLGNFTKDDIIGIVNFRLFPFKKFGKVK